jgi:hypothetical protein
VLAVHAAKQAAGKFLDALDKSIKDFVRQSGPVDLGDGSGRVLGFVPVNKREVAPLAAWPALSERLTDEELAECVKVSLSKCEDAVAAKATGPRGAKSAARKELFSALESAGAVTIKHEDQLRIHRPDSAESEK